jgi:two-component system, NarL family, response regulator LiaR
MEVAHTRPTWLTLSESSRAATNAGNGERKEAGGVVMTDTAGATVSTAMPAGGRTRVLVVDDHDLFRTGLAALLAAEPNLEVVAQASSGRSGVRLAAELRPDVVLMDLRMPDIDGVEATREILQRDPSIPVIVLTVVSDEEQVQAALKAGACGFVAKETPFASLVSAVHAAAEVVLGRLRRERVAQASERAAELSPRELEVLRLIEGGKGNSQIAEALGISPRTVKNHVASILAKLGLPSRVQAAVYAVRSGLT